MDLNSYYTKVKENEGAISDEYPIVVSNATGDGGIAGRMVEVTKRIAARMLVEGAARLASLLEAQSFRDAKAQAKQFADQALTEGRLQLATTAMSELQRLTEAAVTKLVASKSTGAPAGAAATAKE